MPVEPGRSMKALVIREFAGPSRIEEVPRPPAPADGVVIRVAATGVCRSDWHAWMGHDSSIRLPHVPGHELAGVIDEVGPLVSTWVVGDRVTVPFCCGCGTCDSCQGGDTHLCEREYQPGFTGWGSFAEYVALPYADTNLIRLPEDLDFASAAALGCRFMTAFHAVTSQSAAGRDDWLAVHGCGGVGLSLVQIGTALGLRVVAVDIDAEKLALAGRLGAVSTVNAAAVDAVAAVRDATGGGAHISIDALGSSETVTNSVLCLRRRGRHVQIGLVGEAGDTLAIPMSRVIALELEVVGSHGMPVGAYDTLLSMITEGRLDPGELIRKRIGLGEVAAEFDAMTRFATSGFTVVEF